MKFKLNVFHCIQIDSLDGKSHFNKTIQNKFSRFWVVSQLSNLVRKTILEKP